MRGRLAARQPRHGCQAGAATRFLAKPEQLPVAETEVIMLKWAAIFFVIAIVAAVLGFGGIAAGATEIAKILFFVFLVIFLVTLIFGMMRK